MTERESTAQWFVCVANVSNWLNRQVAVRRDNAQVPLCINLGHVAILALFRATKKSYLRVDDCFEVRC